MYPKTKETYRHPQARGRPLLLAPLIHTNVRLHFPLVRKWGAWAGDRVATCAHGHSFVWLASIILAAVLAPAPALTPDGGVGHMALCGHGVDIGVFPTLSRLFGWQIVYGTHDRNHVSIRE